MIIKRAIKFAVQNQQNADSRVRMRVSYNSTRVDFQTGIVLNKANWDDLQQRVLPTNSNATLANELNDHLSQMLADMIAVFHDFELQKVIPTASVLPHTAKTWRITPKKIELLVFNKWILKRREQKTKTFGSAMTSLSKSTAN